MFKKKIIFRADGNSEIGLGHVTRSLALAEMLSQDFNCIFAIQQPTTNQQKEILSICSGIIALSAGDAHFQQFLALLEGNEIVVLDNYFYSTAYQKEIKSKGCKLVCIDDFCDKHFVADAVICHGPMAKVSDYSCENYTKLYLGLHYALLRKPFREQVKEPAKHTLLKTAFVCFGGSDSFNLTQQTVEILLLNNISNVNVIVGDAYLHLAALNELSKNCNIRIYHSVNAPTMLSLMTDSDFAIAPASSVLLELFTVGMPVITGYYAENQKEGSIAICDLGLAFNTGNFLLDYKSNLTKHISELLAGNGSEMGRQQKSSISDSRLSYFEIFKNL